MPEGAEGLPEGPMDLLEGPKGMQEGPEDLPEWTEGLPGGEGDQWSYGGMDGWTESLSTLQDFVP